MAQHPSVFQFKYPNESKADGWKGLVEAQKTASELIVAKEEMIELQQQLADCFFKNQTNHFTECRDLALEYRKRLGWPGFIPPEGEDTSSVVNIRQNQAKTREV